MINLWQNLLFKPNLKCQSNFYLKKERKKQPVKTADFSFIKKKNSRCFVIGGLIDMNVAVFWETYVGFLKNALSQNFPNYS